MSCPKQRNCSVDAQEEGKLAKKSHMFILQEKIAMIQEVEVVYSAVGYHDSFNESTVRSAYQKKEDIKNALSDKFPCSLYRVLVHVHQDPFILKMEHALFIWM